jgi:hypothetical protein
MGALIVEFAAKSGLATMYPQREFVNAGGLIAYGVEVVTSSAERPAMSTKFSRARSQVIYQSSSQASLNWQSISV